MAVAIAYWTFLLSSCLLVLWYGRTVERAFLMFLVFCTFLIVAVHPKHGVLDSRHALFAIDVTILLVVLAIMPRSHAHWPIWFAGFHTITVATGLARLLLPAEVPGLYINAAGFWSLPALLTLVIGAMLDQRVRTANALSALSP